MAVSQAVLGYGTLLQRGDIATATGFVTVAEVKKLDGPKMKKDNKEVTHMLSPGGYKEFIGGLKDGGEVTLTLNFIPSDTTQDQIAGCIFDFENNIRRFWQQVWPTDPLFSAQYLAEIMNIDIKTPIDDAIEMDVTLKMSGAPTWA